jgi:hypothetical protein
MAVDKIKKQGNGRSVLRAVRRFHVARPPSFAQSISGNCRSERDSSRFSDTASIIDADLSVFRCYQMPAGAGHHLTHSHSIVIKRKIHFKIKMLHISMLIMP